MLKKNNLWTLVTEKQRQSGKYSMLRLDIQNENVEEFDEQSYNLMVKSKVLPIFLFYFFTSFNLGKLEP